jgi:hypothetical protein
MITDEQIINFIENGLKPLWKYEEYFKKVSTKKLIDAAIRVIHPHIQLYTAQEAIFEEMIRRLKKNIGAREMLESIARKGAKDE